MPMPNIEISFRESGETLIERSETGTLLLILRGNVPSKNPLEITEESEIPSTVSKENKNYINMALLGNETAPKKVFAFFLSGEGDVSDALSWAETHSADWLAMPTAETDEVVDTIKDWVNNQKKFGNEIRAVLPNCNADGEHVVNYTTEKVSVGSTDYTAEQFCVRVAGAICGTDLSHSITYAVIPEATDCTRLTKSEMDAAVDAGQLIAFWDGEKVKFARGVNSLVTTTAEKGKQFQKIKISQICSVIKNDLKRVCQDQYIGKFANTYSNRCLLLCAVQDYFDGLILDGLISSHEVTFDVSAIKVQMKKAGISYSDLADQDIIEYDFGSSVFFKCKLNILDAIEDITFDIEI